MKLRERHAMDAAAPDRVNSQGDLEVAGSAPAAEGKDAVSGSPVRRRRRKANNQASWAVAFGTGGFTTLCILLTYHILQSVILSQRAAFHVDESKDSREIFYQKTLAFDVCNGMANQRLSLLYGVVLAYELGRAVVLPDFLLSGVQWTDADTLASKDNMVPMGDIYDVKHFVYSMSTVGIDVLFPEEAPPRDLFTKVKLDGMDDPVDELQLKHLTTQHLYVGCPLFRLHGYYFTASNSRVMWAVLNGMRPNAHLSKLVNGITGKLKSHTPAKAFNFVHLRMETDWVLHCARWENIPDGRIRNNCMNNTDDIHRVLYALNVPTEEPLYVASFWEQCDLQRSDRILALLGAAGYKVYTSKDFKLDVSGEDREVNAMIDYEIAMQSHKFIGNSVSTFSALLLHQRRHNALWASYYNTGNIPVSDFLPMDLLPWVFVYSDDQPEWDTMVKAAVLSATHYHTMRIYCIWIGRNTSAPIYKWMLKQGVRFIHHEPEWWDDLLELAEQHLRINQQISPVYTNPASLLADYIRIDLPLMPELEQYIYVLFTEPDIFFAKKMGLSQVPLPLPDVVGFPEDPLAPGGLDSGIMLVDLPALREDYDDFKLHIFANRHGGYFPGFPAGAAGAYVSFYQSAAKHMTLSVEFGAKPWQEFQAGAKIVHFEGPKPHEYMSYYRSLKCPHYSPPVNKCLRGFRQGLCPYVKKWHKLLNETEDEVGLALWYGCTAVFAPHLEGICKHPLRVGNVTD